MVYSERLVEAITEVDTVLPPADVTFRRGDSNGDSEINISDPVFLLNALFGGGPSGPCKDASDVNDDSSIDVSDPIFLLAFVFLGEAAPPEPFSVCDTDPTPDDLNCGSLSECQ